ncbi:MAG: HlyD family efflux transporter periplasmic adaptor subunit [Terracidiphilus sp.]|jgi:putative peptide zinc metalloprotease protein
MNLSEALDAALPEIPKTRTALKRPPALDPDLVVREDFVDGEPVVAVMQRGSNSFFRFMPLQWQILQLFDGARTYDEIAELFTAQTGMPIGADQLRTFAETMERDNFWYKTPQEKNLALSQKLTDQRARRAARKSKFNLAHMSFPGWDPDNYLSWLDNAVGRFVYSPWCTLAVVLLFLFEASVFIAKWNVIGPDIPVYYNFTQKTLLDLAQFWLLFLALGFIHETAHGLTCKHYGGQVHSMGLMFIYLMPAFYVDVTEMWISATRVQRLATIIAGIWIEMVVCGIGMIVWTNTLPGQWLHDFSYQIILITGIAVVVMNLNPLIKLDGYYFLTEAIGIPDLKERSTSLISGWFQSRVLRLPVEMTTVARKRAPFFILYAVVSGIYSYTLLFFVIRLSYNIGSKWLAEFALIPAAALAFLMFRSRLRALRGTAARFWQHHVASIRNQRPIYFAAAALLAVILFVPFWRDRESAYFVIEPARSGTVHAAVSGRVQEVLVHEGESIRAGQALLIMTSPTADSMAEAAVAQTRDASFQAFNAELQGQSVGQAEAEQDAAKGSSLLAGEARSSLVVTAPEDAVVLTAHPDTLLGQSVGSGQSLLDLAAAGPRLVRVYVPVTELDRIPANSEVALALPGSFSIVRMALATPGGEAVSLPQGLVRSQEYKGIKMPVFYSSRMTLPASAGNPPFGIGGEANIFGKRRSLIERFATSAYNLAKAHLW